MFKKLLQFFFYKSKRKDDYISHLKEDKWGKSLMIMEKDGKSYGRMYWYFDDKYSVYLEGLSVSENSRKQGLGTKMQTIRENTGRRLGASLSFLWVEKNSWMHAWYKRRGYIDWRDHEDEKNAIWMRKIL